ncbi:hypothetical protein QBC39DRAFT_70325 [Podospora conica]|nr:hypothetical protein QBC39DRAFT_70325 [Schizothecium conicum]
MFVHSGVGLHGHEYSSRSHTNGHASPAAPNLRNSIRSSLVPPKHRSNQLPDGPLRPALRQRPVSEYIPRKTATPEPIVRFQQVEEELGPAEDEMTPFPAFDDPTVSESELSEATAFSSDAPTTRSNHRRSGRRRRTLNHSTQYCLGYPTPTKLAKTKVIKKVLPRLLLQLQKVTQDGRSRPCVEAFPASRIAGPVITPRLAKRFPGIFGVKRHLGYDDVVLVRRDDDDILSEEDSDCEDLEQGKLLAVFSPVKHSDEAEIVLEDGSIWVAKPRPNGSFDFVFTDIHGVPKTVRWARRNTVSHHGTVPSVDPSTGIPLPSSTPPPARFTFSVINPLTRRHPVMATLSPSLLEVQDTYTSVSPSHSRYPPHRVAGRTLSMTGLPPISLAGVGNKSPAKRMSVGSSTEAERDDGIIALQSELEPARAVHSIDDATKMLISVTAMWVALRSGWSAAPVSNLAEPTSPAFTARARRNTWGRGTSETSSQTPQLSDAETTYNYDPKRYSMPLPLTDKALPSPSRTPPPMSSPPSPRRATSTGAAFMQRRLQRAEAGDVESVKKTCRRRNSSHSLRRISSEAVVNNKPYKTAAPKRGMGGDKDAAVIKKGMRQRLSRWIHKLGSR